MQVGADHRTLGRKDARAHVEVVRRERVGCGNAFADAARNGLRDAADLFHIVDVDRARTVSAPLLRRVGRRDRDRADRLLREVPLGDDELDRAAQVLLAGHGHGKRAAGGVEGEVLGLHASTCGEVAGLHRANQRLRRERLRAHQAPGVVRTGVDARHVAHGPEVFVRVVVAHAVEKRLSATRTERVHHVPETVRVETVVRKALGRHVRAAAVADLEETHLGIGHEVFGLDIVPSPDRVVEDEHRFAAHLLRERFHRLERVADALRHRPLPAARAEELGHARHVEVVHVYLVLEAVGAVHARRGLHGVQQNELTGLLEELAHLRVGLHDNFRGAVGGRLALRARGEVAAVGVEDVLVDEALALADLLHAAGIGVDVVVAEGEEVVARLTVELDRLLGECAAVAPVGVRVELTLVEPLAARRRGLHRAMRARGRGECRRRDETSTCRLHCLLLAFP